MGPLAAAVVRAASLTAAGGVVLNESFDTADGPTLGPDLTWSEYVFNCDWSIVSNAAEFTDTGGTDGYAVTDASSLGDNQYGEGTFTFRMAGGGAATGIGIVLRASGTSEATLDGYLAVMGVLNQSSGAIDDLVNRRQLTIARIDNGTPTPLASVSIGTQNAVSTYDLRFEVDGSSLWAQCDDGNGPFTTSTTDSTYTTGDKVGLYGCQSGDNPRASIFEAGDL